VRQFLGPIVATVLLLALALINESGLHVSALVRGRTAGADLDSGSDSGSGSWTRELLLNTQPWRQYAGRLPDAMPCTTPSALPAYLPADRVGALFDGGLTGKHFCTASVVNSPGRDLLITAAHCLDGGKHSGYKRDIVFVPGYANGTAPFGVWTPRELIVDKLWSDSSDPDDDVGFVVLKPDDGKNIQDVVGANQVGFDAGFANFVRVTGYPSSVGTPVTCRNWTTQESDTQLEFQCGGYFVGTSGSPWLSELAPSPTPALPSSTRTATIIGVIGGYEQGGDTAAISYSPYFGAGIRELYERAETASASPSS
jgi:V8-like Glu-specific endopeptidase